MSATAIRALLPIGLLLLLAGCAVDEPAGRVSLASGNLLLDASHGDGDAWGLADCAACHPLGVIHEKADTIRELVRAKGYASCTACHGRNGTTQPRRCRLCHNATDLPRHPPGDGLGGHDFDRDRRLALTDADCVTCHSASDMDGRFEIDRDLTRFPDASGQPAPYADGSDFCLRCHNRDHPQPGHEPRARDHDDPLIAIEDDWRYVDKHGRVDGGGRTYAGLREGYAYASRVACSDCHTLHGTRNAALIIERSDQGASRLTRDFRDTPWPVTVEAGDFSQLCVLCHAMRAELEQGATDTGNGLSGVHRTGEDCRPCHSHGEAAQAGM